MSYLKVFKMPKVTTIMARTSSITNAFFNGIIPCIKPTECEVKKVLDMLGMNINDVRCAYCGDTMTEWDHFRPLVINKLPTGYITEINNLVPACGKCNQSKGNSYWKDWINSNATLSPKTRNVKNLDVIIERLSNFESNTTPTKLNILSIVGEDLWNRYLNNLDNMHKQMRECQDLSDEIKNKISDSLNANIKPKIVNEQKIVNNTYRKIGQIVQDDFVKLLTSGNVPINVIDGLKDLEFSKQFLNITFPVLKEVFGGDINLQMKDHLGYNRYYATPIHIQGKTYLLTSQWKESSRQNLLNFMETVKLLKEN